LLLFQEELPPESRTPWTADTQLKTSTSSSDTSNADADASTRRVCRVLSRILIFILEGVHVEMPPAVGYIFLLMAVVVVVAVVVGGCCC
jgi:hypothetical protein